jgi:type III pantothenate kinase
MFRSVLEGGLMLLAVDIGNTETTIGVFDGEEVVKEWRIATQRERTADELALIINSFLRLDHITDIDGVAASSVVPRATQAMRELVPKYFDLEPVIVEPGIKTGMPIRVDNPKEVGADRIANAVGALELFEPPIIVVDFSSTATIFDAISAKGEYLGGTIVPGLEVSLDALIGRAAMLRRVELVEPRSVIGRSVVESIQAGAVYGTVDAVDGIVQRFQRELGQCEVVATGGLASLIGPLSSTIKHHEPWLTLRGLRTIYEKNT